MYVEYVSLLQSCDVCDAASGSLSSYAYILMLLHYLQNVTPPVIPVLQQVNATISKPDPTDHAFTLVFAASHFQLKPPGVKTEGHVIDDWDCYYYRFTTIEDLVRSYSNYVHHTFSGKLLLPQISL